MFSCSMTGDSIACLISLRRGMSVLLVDQYSLHYKYYSRKFHKHVRAVGLEPNNRYYFFIFPFILFVPHPSPFLSHFPRLPTLLAGPIHCICFPLVACSRFLPRTLTCVCELCACLVGLHCIRLACAMGCDSFHTSYVQRVVVCDKYYYYCLCYYYYYQ